jgi:tryptophanyl-tRNA synthetase
MARDFAQRFNHLFAGNYFTLPEAAIEENVATLPGLDGRKMSKSYDNTIPLFVPRAEMKKLIDSIVTDSRAPGEPKQADGSHVFQLYQAFSSGEETEAMREAFEQGIGWGEAKRKLFERIDAEVAPMRERYEALMASPGEIEAILQDGACRLRARYATPFLAELRQAVGLRDLSSQDAQVQAGAKERTALPSFKQYRDTDNRFYFKFLDAEGELLVQSDGFDSPKQAGQLIALLKRGEQADALETTQIRLLASTDSVLAALRQLRDAEG